MILVSQRKGAIPFIILTLIHHTFTTRFADAIFSRRCITSQLLPLPSLRISTPNNAGDEVILHLGRGGSTTTDDSSSTTSTSTKKDTSKNLKRNPPKKTQQQQQQQQKQQRSTISASSKKRGSTMPTIFDLSKENEYDRYAACLAAMEGLNRVRVEEEEDGDVGGEKNKGLTRGLFGRKTKKGSASDGGEKVKQAHARYVVNSARLIKALGLTVTRFNEIGKEMELNSDLKERVKEQAYLYRMAATIDMERVPRLLEPTTPTTKQQIKPRIPPPTRLIPPKNLDDEKIKKFCESMKQIEKLRSEQTSRLEHALKIDSMPQNINLCDPTILPLLSPKVRAVCEAFPLQAEEIVKKCGLDSEEFNQMLEETKGSFMFRRRVRKFMGSKGGISGDGDDADASRKGESPLSSPSQ